MKKLLTTADNLSLVASRAIQSGQSDESTPMTDCLRLLSRLCAARGRKVPLFDLQHDPPPSRGFMADPRIRISELNNQWGYDIRQEFEGGEQERSVRWIILGADGLPLINPDAPKRQNGKRVKPGCGRQGFTFGNARATAGAADKAAVNYTSSGEVRGAQPNLFRTFGDVRAFCSRETGAIK